MGRAVVLAVVAALGIAGCGSATRATVPTPSTTGPLAPQANPDGSLTLAVGAEPANWNVDSAAGASASLQDVLDPVWPSVFHVGADGVAHLDTTFVTSATETASDPQTVVYRINPKAVWSDGVPITAADFTYDWQARSGLAQYRDLGGAPFAAAPAAGYADVSSVVAGHGDPDVVEVAFARPDPDWQALFATLVPAHVAERVGFSTGFGDPVADDVSGGPFLVQGHVRGTSVTEVRNPRYWGAPSGLASVTFRFLADPSQAPAALGAGVVDAAVVAPDVPLVAALDALAPTVTYDQVDGYSWEDLEFNQRNRWLRNPAVRQAISLAVDRKGLIAKVVGAYDPAALPLDNHLFVPGEPGYQDDSGNLYNGAEDQKALQVLQAGGFTLVGGVLTDSGSAVTVRITADAGDPARQAEEQYLAEQLAPVGIKVTEVDVADLPSTLAAGDFDLAVTSHTDSPFVSAEDATYHSVDAATGAGGDNHVGYSDGTVDSLLAEASLSTGATRLGIYDQVDAALWRDNVDLPLFQRAVGLALRPTVQGVAADPTGEGVTWDMATWTDRAPT